MSELKEFVFLTRAEIYIRSSYELTVHLRQDESRSLILLDSTKAQNLNIITVDPLVKWVGTFQSGKFYHLPKIIYTGKVKSKGFYHFSFHWRNKYRISKDDYLMLDAEQIRFFRKNNYINAN
jgi:hypothetical protein